MINKELEKKWKIRVFSEEELDNLIEIFDSRDLTYNDKVIEIRKILNTDDHYEMFNLKRDLDRFYKFFKRSTCALIGLNDNDIKKQDVSFPNAIYIKKFYKVYSSVLDLYHTNKLLRFYALPQELDRVFNKSLDDLSELYSIVISHEDANKKIIDVCRFFTSTNKEEFFKKFLLLKTLSVFDDYTNAQSYAKMLDSVHEFVQQNVTGEKIQDTKNMIQEEEKDFARLTKVRRLYRYYETFNAEQRIRLFIESEDKYDFFKFCSNNHIHPDTFKYCLKLVKVCNPDLYQEYLKVYESIRDKKYATYCKILEGLANDVDECESNGETFDIIEFYLRVPFKGSKENFVKDLKRFLSNMNNKKAASVLYRYIGKNKIDKFYFTTKDAELSKLSRSEISYGGKKYTPEIVEKIFEYMDYMGYPYISRVYDKLLINYMTDKIDIDSIIKKEKEYKAEFPEMDDEEPFSRD